MTVSKDFSPVPNALLEGTLEAADSVNELKVSLRLCRLLYLCRERPPRVHQRQVLGDDHLRRGLQVVGSPTMTERNIREGLALAVDRGTFLHLKVSQEGTGEDWYLLNTERARAYVEKVLGGALDARRERLIGPSVAEPEVELARPNVFTLYEQNIGLLSPLIADQLTEMDAAYPADWIEAAFREAVNYNRRNLRYVQRVLENWALAGKDGGPADRRRRVKEQQARYDAR